VIGVKNKVENYKTFVNNLREGGEVILHWDYVVERLPKE